MPDAKGKPIKSMIIKGNEYSISQERVVFTERNGETIEIYKIDEIFSYSDLVFEPISSYLEGFLYSYTHGYAW